MWTKTKTKTKSMKRTFPFLISGIVGGLIVLLGFVMLEEETAISERNNNAHLTRATITAGSPVPTNFHEAAEIAMPAVVHIKASESEDMAAKRYGNQRRSPFDLFFGDGDFFGGNAPQRAGTGSGVIISPDGYIVTNNHVIDYADQFEVTLFDDRTFTASLIGKDPRTDLAVIKIDTDDLPYLSMGNSDDVRVGDWVLAVGNPFDLTSTVTAGIVSAKGREKIIRQRDAIEDFIQTDAVVNPGNSGGALVNTAGELIGVNTAIATATGYYAGYSFAIPANMLEGVVDNIIEHGGPRGRIGVEIAGIEAYEEYIQQDLGVNKGVVVTKVEQGGAAEVAGLIASDIITELDGRDVESPDEMVKYLGGKKIGDKVSVKLLRDGKAKNLVVYLKAS